MKAKCVSWPEGSEVANTFDGHHMSGSKRKYCTDLDELVPASGDDDGVLGVRGEANAGDPLGVALVGDGVLAVTEGVPQLDGAVTGARDDLTVVGGEADGQDVVVVADEAAGGLAGGELPQAEGLVPGGGQSVGAVGGDHTVGDDVGVAVERALGVAVGGLITGQVPDDEGLVTGTGQKHVRAIALLVVALVIAIRCMLLLLERGGKGSDPAGVALKGAAEDELLSHCDELGRLCAKLSVYVFQSPRLRAVCTYN